MEDVPKDTPFLIIYQGLEMYFVSERSGSLYQTDCDADIDHVGYAVLDTL